MNELQPITIPPGHVSADDFCLWVVKTSLKGKVSPRAINQMGLHKWWLIRDFSKGANTPETYSFFVNINIDKPQISNLNTAVVAWSPVPFGWSLWERLKRTVKRTNYPTNGDVLQVIPLNEYMSCPLYHMKPTGYAAKDSRKLWDIMQNMGWVLVAQGETHTPKE